MKSLPLPCFIAAIFLAPSLKAEEAFPDKLLTTPTTPDIVAKGLEADGYQLGISAYAWGYPLVPMERVARQYTAPRCRPTISTR
ncbi:hypothetical protein ACFIOY_09795 [Bradyrhizobium sp. TZ2]